MISTESFVNSLLQAGVEFFTGVPDSILGNLCGFIENKIDKDHHVIAANEGNAIALSAGYHMATGTVPCVYLQNSGLGNTVNPIISLADPSVYGFPMLLLIGWRGEPGTPDEPQHIRQGELTIPLLDALGIPHYCLTKNEKEADQLVVNAVAQTKTEKRPVAILISKNTFQPVKFTEKTSPERMSREQAIELVVACLSNRDLIVSTTGKASRELYETRERNHQSHETDFLVVGSMGHASQIAAGIALAKPKKRIICLDGDGAMLMHLGAVAINGGLSIPNLKHIILNNGAHDSVGGMPTVGLEMSVAEMARACGYTTVVSVDNQQELQMALPEFMESKGPSLMNIVIRTGSRADLGRPKTAPSVCKDNFMKCLQQ